MRIAVIGDIHGNGRHVDSMKGILGDADVVVICGDFSVRHESKRALEFLNTVERIAPRIVAVHGNWDRSEIREALEKKGYSVHGRGVRIGRVGFFGVGGSHPSLFRMPAEHTEEEASRLLASGYRDVSDAECKVLVSHMPPRGVCDRTIFGFRGGSRAVRRFLDSHEVDLCLAGHVHEARGAVQYGVSLVVNPGPFSKGRFAVVTFGDGVEAVLGVCRSDGIRMEERCGEVPA